jgi:hypothetical protein
MKMNNRPDPLSDMPATPGVFRTYPVEICLILFIIAYTLFAAGIALAFDMKWPFVAAVSSYWATRAFALFFLTLVTLLAISSIRRRKLWVSQDLVIRAAMFLIIPNYLIGFSLVKNTLHLFPGVNFDTQIAALDQWLHFGMDAWQAYLPVLDSFTFLHGSAFYHPIWTAHLLLGPALIILLDRNRVRRLCYVVTYIACWVLLGNIMAASFYSVGPIFVAPILGDETRFAAMAYLFQGQDFTLSFFAPAIEFLSIRHMTGEITAGAAISAMPSMHVAMAALIAIYIIRIRWWLAPIGLFYLMMIQAFSVLSGMHYAVDGYVSIIAVAFIWWFMHRLLNRGQHAA